MLKFFSGFLLMFAMPDTEVFSQKQTEHGQQVWIAYSNQTRVSQRWGLWGDFHLRTKEHFVSGLSQGIARAGLTYYANDNVRLTGGYAYVNAYPADNHANISRPEHRPWQQVQWFTNINQVKVMQWVRLEERFRRKVLSADALADGYNFNYRLRYAYQMTIPLGHRPFAARSLSAVVNDEVHVNFGKEVQYNVFDQNRFFAGFAYHVSPADNVQFGYMNQYQQLAAGNKYRMVHAPRVFFFHNLDFRKKSADP